jgi:hypothetical protein
MQSTVVVFPSLCVKIIDVKFKSNLKLKNLPTKSSNLFHLKPELNSRPMNYVL